MSSSPIVISPSEAEVAAGKLSQENLEIGIRSLYQDGFVVLENAISYESLDNLNSKMVEDALELKAMGSERPYNFVPSNLAQNIPPTVEYFKKDVFLNPLITQIVATYLGAKPRWGYWAANTVLPCDAENPPQSQPTHPDAYFDHPKHPFSLVVSVPLVNMTPENGSTEIWLGTHDGFGSTRMEDGMSLSSGAGGIIEAQLRERMKVRPPSQPVVPKGAVVFRDIRLWHGGKPNLSKDIRVLLSMVYFAPWYRNNMRMPVIESVKEILESQQDLEIAAEYITENEAREKYFVRNFGYPLDFTQQNSTAPEQKHNHVNSVN